MTKPVRYRRPNPEGNLGRETFLYAIRGPRSILQSLVFFVFALVFIILFFLCLLEPLKERFGGFANFLASSDVDVFLAGFGTPSFEDIFRDEIFLVVSEEDFGNLRDEIGVLVADKALGSSQKCFLMPLRGYHLHMSVVACM